MKRRVYLLFIFIIIFSIINGASYTYANQTLHVALKCDMQPYQYIDHDDVYTGLHIDILNRIAKNKKLNIVYIPYEYNSDCLEALSKGSVDVVLGYKTGHVNASAYRSTSALSSSSIAMIALKEEILRFDKGHRLYSAALEYGAVSYAHMNKMGLKSYNVYGSEEDIIDALIDGKVDVAVGVRDSLMWMLKQREKIQDYDVLFNYIDDISYSFLLRLDNKELFELLDEGLMELRTSGEYEKLYKRWIPDSNLEMAHETIHKIITWFAILGGIALLLILISILLNFTLRRLVAQKTKQLTDVNADLEQSLIRLQNEGFLRSAIIEDSPMGMVYFEGDNSIVIINSKALKLCGYSGKEEPEKVTELPIISEILNEIDYDTDLLTNYGKGFRYSGNFEIGSCGNNRNYRYHLYHSKDITDIGGVLMTIEDVTEEEQRKTALFEAEKNKQMNRLIAGIAHEIKNPLMSIRTAASLIATDGNDPEVQKAFSRFVPVEVDRINQLIESFINYLRPAKGDSEVIMVDELIRDCMYLADIAAKKGNIKIRTFVGQRLFIHANKNKIKQSIVNLMINSVDSMKKKCSMGNSIPLYMDISAKLLCDDIVIISIRDEGIGMDENDIERCTEPFYSTKVAGAGLGLSLVKQFIEENNGKLTIESKLGEYTNVTMKFRRYKG